MIFLKSTEVTDHEVEILDPWIDVHEVHIKLFFICFNKVQLSELILLFSFGQTSLSTWYWTMKWKQECDSLYNSTPFPMIRDATLLCSVCALYFKLQSSVTISTSFFFVSCRMFFFFFFYWLMPWKSLFVPAVVIFGQKTTLDLWFPLTPHWGRGEEGLWCFLSSLGRLKLFWMVAVKTVRGSLGD